MQEAMIAAGDRRQEVKPFHNEHNSEQFWAKIVAFADGKFTDFDAASIAVIQSGSDSMRSGGAVFKSNASTQDRQLAELPFADYLNAATPMWSEAILMQKLLDAFPRATGPELQPIVRKLLANDSYRTSQAMVRADLYARWRALRTSVPRDLHGDALNVVHAAYCDVYATGDGNQEDWASLVLTKTRFALYSDSFGSTDDWLISIL